jgi:hypothetical protein
MAVWLSLTTASGLSAVAANHPIFIKLAFGERDAEFASDILNRLSARSVSLQWFWHSTVLHSANSVSLRGKMGGFSESVDEANFAIFSIFCPTMLSSRSPACPHVQVTALRPKAIFCGDRRNGALP